MEQIIPMNPLEVVDYDKYEETVTYDNYTYEDTVDYNDDVKRLLKKLIKEDIED